MAHVLAESYIKAAVVVYAGLDCFSEYHDQNLTDSDEPPSEDEESRDNFNRGSNGNRVRASNATITPETFMTHMTFGHR